MLKSPLTLAHLPNEIIDKVFRFLSFEEIAKKRIVNRRFNQIGSSILNNEFQSLRNYTHQRFQAIKSQMPRRESLRRKHPLARECEIIETLHMRLTLLQMTFGKHIERRHCCFFAGEILDEVHRTLRYLADTPVLHAKYKITDELFDLSTMAMEFFKEFIEPTLPEISYFAIDLYDSYSPTMSSNSPKTQLSLMNNTDNTVLNTHRITSTKSSSSSSETNFKHRSQSSPSSSSSLPETSNVTHSVTHSVTITKRKMKQFKNDIKQNIGQITILKRELRTTKRKVSQQERSMVNLKCRINDYDKKFETTSRKLSAVMEELSKCKTELQYWRSKSPLNSTPLNGWKLVEMDLCECGCGSIKHDKLNHNQHHNHHQLPHEIFQPINDLSEENISCSKETCRRKPNDAKLMSKAINVDEKSQSVSGECSSKSFCKRKLDYVDPEEEELVVKKTANSQSQ